MIEPGTVRGALGQVKDDYFTAAVLQEWIVRFDDARRAWVLTATVMTTDPYRLTRTGLRFVAPHKRGAWRWPIASLAIVGAQLTAELGALEE